jgi:hypothetical protein
MNIFDLIITFVLGIFRHIVIFIYGDERRVWDDLNITLFFSSPKHLTYNVILFSKHIYHNSIDVSSIIHFFFFCGSTSIELMGASVWQSNNRANEVSPELDKLSSHHNYDKWELNQFWGERRLHIATMLTFTKLNQK